MIDLKKKPIVSISKSQDLKTAVKFCLNQIKLPDLSGKTVLLKPNVGREVDPYLGINTNPDVVEAVFLYLQEKFDAEFWIGDSPIINTDTINAFDQSGYSHLLERKDLKFINLDDRPPIELDIPEGQILTKIKVTGYWEDIDSIISIPVLKMHMHCGASLSFKNLKGLIYKRNKIKLHHFRAPELIDNLKKSMKKVKELDVAISDLLHIFKPSLSIIDATYALEGMGPSSGTCVKLDTIIASTNYLAADIVSLAISQPSWSLKDVPHLELISKLHPDAPRSIKDIKIIPEDIQEFIKPLEPPPSSISIKYKNVNLIDIESCSACLSTVFNLLKNNKEFIDEHFTQDNPLNIAIGKGIKQSDLYSDTFLIGNCTYELHEKGIFIEGCTPVESTILKVIKEQLKKRKK
jgi:uncharacterized protein (DUF362 family)